MGQALLPEHFYAQEHALREEFDLRLQLGALPCWGVGALQWDTFQIQEGVINLKALTVVFPSGSIIDIPGNTAPCAFNLNSTGASKVALYLHLESDYDVTTTEAASSGAHADESSIERIVQKVSLTTTPHSDTALQTFKLMEFDKSVTGIWALGTNYIPPLARIGHSPFFDRYLKRMSSIAGMFHEILVDEIQQNFLAGESQQAAKQCLRALYVFQNQLANIGHDIKPHPYQVFRLICDFYIDVCVYRDTRPREIERVYEHEDIAPRFNRLLDELEEQVQLTKTATPYTAFVPDDGLMVCQLAEGAKRAKDIFWLVQKPRVAANLELTGVKLAARGRIQSVHQRALRGIPYVRIENPPFHHNFSNEVEFYAITPGEEWDHAVREGCVSFYEKRELEDLRFFIYWRND
ncbi:MAG: hypothetical protein RL701_3910 [Pseudomonadota bacterium]|jgi:type VI secretion system protein ImpJ